MLAFNAVDAYITGMTKVPRQGAFCECGDHFWKPLTKGFVTYVEPQDAAHLCGWNWSAHVAKNGRVTAVRRTNADGKLHYLHVQIMEPPAGFVVDHMKGQSLDNRRGEMRVCRQRDNTRNRTSPKTANQSSKFKGVWSRGRGKWAASIRPDGKTRHLGTFTSEIAAAIAYNTAAAEAFGEYANLNPIPQEL